MFTSAPVWVFLCATHRPRWSAPADSSTGEFAGAFYCSGLYPISRRRNIGQNCQRRCSANNRPAAPLYLPGTEPGARHGAPTFAYWLDVPRRGEP